MEKATKEVKEKANEMARLGAKLIAMRGKTNSLKHLVNLKMSTIKGLWKKVKPSEAASLSTMKEFKETKAWTTMEKAKAITRAKA